jgi:hypothetical protein
MTKIKSFTVGLPVTGLKRAVEWYRQLLGEVEEVNPAPGVWEFQIVPSGWLQLFESEINEPNQSVMRFESHDIEKRGQLLIRTHNEPLSVAAMRVGNPGRSPLGINR